MNSERADRSADLITPGPKPSAAKIWLKAIELTSRIEAEPARLFADIVEDWAAKQPERPALISDRETLSYRQLAAHINQYARWALANGIGPGSTVALMMPSRPEYLAAWLGISRVGGVVALINTNLVGSSLAHCINVAGPAHVIVASEFRDAYASAAPLVAGAARVWSHGELDAALAAMTANTLAPAERPVVTIDDRALLIYTSGTTGLPKAASISHRRILNWGGWFAGLTGAGPDDRLYDCLPVYHSVGGIVAPCSMLRAGGAAVLAEKFSASNFWRDIVRHDCTLVQYIGELCRYLLAAAPSDLDRTHRLRLACGNGLRGDVWEAFRARFAIPDVLEFYAATEGNFSLYNVEGRVGSIGRVPSLLAHRFPAAIIQLDAEQRTPLRGIDGLCVPCARGEVGEAVGRIGTADKGGGRFEGYTDTSESKKKILRDVFAKGDAWFRTGDLMRQDEQGFFYFVDRVGDTFRWKGENVATSEVNEAILQCPGVTEATTYGVTVPGADGRAGMAALVVDADFDLATLSAELYRRLPAYAQPVALRITASLDATETFKQKKQQLMRDGFDPSVVGEPLYTRDAATGAYRALDRELYARIVAGEVRL
ncbi:putative fatty acid metabolism AMP-binding protein [Bradyrhizobium oligotrophicum S58]|uniref:Putative fatty acid metabolism AMP-binding protein n=1 Tax=Bradyrhizobium oligotrophicum S58 TaxID=1245469 RepID=M4ZF02_9BRAD|nr:long-chain-acyl-CoA synthetase [Bradyrhizobium oligotrophicum]BAM92427.1 putative fatty acid metabolism AMP-binding protein [Bradyrhizobium oligotrophicum S58]